MFSHVCDSSHNHLLTEQVISKLKALKAKYRETELLMSKNENVAEVRNQLQQINSDFDQLMCLCLYVEEDETMPGSTSHKIDVIKGKDNFNRKVETWLACVHVPSVFEGNPLCESEPSRRTMTSDVLDECQLTESGAGVAVVGHDKSRDKGLCNDTGSGVSTSVSSHSSRASRVRESRVKVRLAQLALRHEEEKQMEEETRRLEEEERRRKEADERRRMAKREKQRELEMAQAELDAWEAESATSIRNATASYRLAAPSRDILPRSAMPEAKPPNFNWCGSVPEPYGDRPQVNKSSKGVDESRLWSRSPIPEFYHTEMSERFLPKPAIENFDGDPLDYWAFVNRFKVHIADRINSDDLKLVYLLQHCSKRVYDKVKHYAGGPDKRQCYKLVWQELYERYGQPHIIGRYCEQRLLELPKVGQYDGENLENMAILLKRCLASLEEFSRSTTMDTVGFIASLVEKLPVELRRKWVSEALKIETRTGTLAGFKDFAEFVISESVEANSTYFRAVFPARSTKNDGYGFKQRKTHTFATTTSTKGTAQAASPVKAKSPNKTEEKPQREARLLSCYCCGQQHKLSNCDEFLQKLYSEKRSVVRDKQLCYRCLRPGHLIKECRSRMVCAVESCKSTSHHTLLHVDPGGARASPLGNVVASCRDEGNTEGQRACLDIVPVCVSFGDAEILTYALLDTGSSVSFCETRLIDRLGLSSQQGRVVETYVETLTTAQPKRLKTESFSLVVKSLDSCEKFNLTNVLRIDHIPVSPDSRNMLDNLDEYEHLRGVTLPRIENATVTLLIGNDNCLAHFPLETRLDPSVVTCPQAVKTPLGWILKGPTQALCSNGMPDQRPAFLLNYSRVPDCVGAMSNVLISGDGDIYPPKGGLDCSDVENLMAWLKANQEVQEFGLRYSAEDVVAYDFMKKSIAHKDGHYVLPLPWKNPAKVLPVSLPMAEKRLAGVKRRMECNSKLKEMYCKEMQLLLDEGHAEIIPEAEWNRSHVWYIPHHPVLNPNKPNKLRIVFDCAARSNGTSLNDSLLKGPDFMNSLMGVLLRFRKGRIAVVADIKKMFYQVRCTPEDCDALRFLWYPDGNTNLRAVPHRMKVHLFGAKSSPSCASFALLQTTKQFGHQYSPTIAAVVRNNFYVDDCLVSVDEDQTGVCLVKELSEMLALGGFHLTKWVSTSEHITNSIDAKERSGSVDKFDLGDQTDERVLGMNWSVSGDWFGYQVTIPEKPATRRGLLSISSSVFDPLGLVSPVILEARLIFRNVCQQGTNWDDPIPLQDAGRWKKWKEDLIELNNVKIFRCLRPDRKLIGIQLHVFADASSYARGSVCYLRSEDVDGTFECRIVSARSRLCGSGVNTIPRLELEAALDAVKLAEFVKRELELQECPCVYWSDSSVVLLSLRAECKKFPVFSRNRLSQIERLTCIHDWRHVPSEFNPADYASRGCTANKLIESSIWFEGPGFLRRTPEYWPNRISHPPVTDHVYTKFDLPKVKAMIAVVHTTDEVASTDRLISHFSSLHKLLLATAWLLRFKQHLRKRAKGNDLTISNQPISTAELDWAEIALVKYVHLSSFPEWILKLSGRKKVVKLPESPALQSLNPILISEVLRVGGRLAKAKISFEAKHPAILPRDHQLTHLIIQDCHARRVGHQGLNATLNCLMQRYWVISPTAAVKAVINKCLLCKRANAKPETQMMSDLPLARLQVNESPFTHTGVDYFGPIMVKQRRSELKRYGCIMTCMTTRAIHLEVAPDLTTSSFLNALRRFISRRGNIQHLYSDNGSNFVGAERVMRDYMNAWNKQQIHNHLRLKGIEWSFNPPGGSHMGGAWERMIGVVKQIFKAILPGKPLDDDALHTILLEVEAMVNSRPLTDVLVDPGSDLPLTPNHLLRINPTIGPPLKVTNKPDVYARQRHRLVQFVADEFWRRWVLEYPRTLFTRSKWQVRRENIRPEDIVLIVDTDAPRGDWPLGRVVNTYPDKEGIVRVAEVQTKSGVIKRPITKLCVIVRASHTEEFVDTNSTSEATVDAIASADS